ncbi:MAG: OsmC family protein [Gammaproteobacteria bacterium]
MKSRVRWVGDTLFLGESGSGHAVVMDGPPESGGRNVGIRPMEMLLLGMGGCTAFDVVFILRKAKQQVTTCEVELSAERAEEYPKVFSHINVRFILSGRSLKPAQVERAIALSAEKYCSASIMLGKSAHITHDFELREAD